MSKNRDRARKLRQNPTDTENFVWSKLRNRRFENFKFRRQFPLGNYFVDFVCFHSRLIIELDGGQHGEPQNQIYDQERDAWLIARGFQVLRFWNHEVLTDWEVIEQAIWQELQKSAHSPISPEDNALETNQ